MSWNMLGEHGDSVSGILEKRIREESRYKPEMAVYKQTRVERYECANSQNKAQKK